MFDDADKARDDLLERHGVRVFDKERVWTTSRNAPRRLATAIPYECLDSGELSPAEWADVEGKVGRRSQAKAARDYALADAR